MFNLEAIKGRRVYKSLYYHYKVHLGLINGMISLNDFQGFREFFIEFENEKSSLSLYKKTLLDIFKAYEFNIELLKNEIQVVSFIEKVMLFRMEIMCL